MKKHTFTRLEKMTLTPIEAARELIKAGAPVEIRGVLNPEIINHRELFMRHLPDGRCEVRWNTSKEKP